MYKNSKKEHIYMIIELEAIILSYCDNILEIVKNIKEYENIISKYGKLFNIKTTDKIIIDEDLKYLKGVHTIDLWGCNKITDKGLEYLKGVHTINLSCCYGITDKGLEYIKGVHTINLTWCNQITDKGLKYLKGVHTIDLYNCDKITDKGLE